MTARNPSGNIIYSDRDHDGMIGKRKRDLGLSYLLTFSIISIYSLLMLTSILSLQGSGIQTVLGLSALWVFGVSFCFWGFRYVMIDPDGKALKHGIMLTDEALSVFGSDIPVYSISRVVIVKARTPQRKRLRIEFKKRMKGTIRSDSIFIRDDDTVSIHKLLQRIEELKTLEEWHSKAP